MFTVKFRGDGDIRKSEIKEEKFEEFFNEEEFEFTEKEKISEESVNFWNASICWGAEKPLTHFKGRAGVAITDEDISLALQY